MPYDHAIINEGRLAAGEESAGWRGILTREISRIGTGGVAQLAPTEDRKERNETKQSKTREEPTMLLKTKGKAKIRRSYPTMLLKIR